MKNIKITIGIAAYNEAKNIQSTLLNILKQNFVSCSLEKIIVISDGSVDATDRIVRTLKNPLIELIADGRREGKAIRVNQIMKRCTTEILVLLDADVEFSSPDVVELLVAPFQKDKTVAITSGGQITRPPHTNIQRIISAGATLWEKVIAKEFGAGAYYCSGGIRAFSRSFYSRFEFPPIKSEDVFPYLYCKKNKMGTFVYVPEAAVFFTLPRNFSDYISQTRRYLTAIDEQEGYFDDEFIASEFTITTKDKLCILLQQWFSNPLWISLYVLLNLYAHIDASLQPRRREAVWNDVASSK